MSDPLDKRVSELEIIYTLAPTDRFYIIAGGSKSIQYNSFIAALSTAFSPIAHTHDYSSLTGIPSSFPPDPHTHDFFSLTGIPSTFPPSAHTHPDFVGDSGAGGVAGFVPAPAAGDAAANKFLNASGVFALPPGAGGGEANTASNIGASGEGFFKSKVGLDLQFKNLSVTSQFILVNDTPNNNVALQVHGVNMTAVLSVFTSALKGLVPLSGGGTANFLRADASFAQVAYANLSGIPGTFAPSAHNHIATEITSGTLPTARMPALTGDVTSTVNTVATTIANDAVTNTKLANMAANSIKLNNTGSPADPIDGSVAQAMALLGAAPLAAPAFTGVPTAPTAAYDTDTTQIATTEFVQDAVSQETEIPKTAAFTLALTDAGRMVTFNAASTAQCTIPANSTVAFPIGTRIDLLQLGAGQLTIAPTGAATLFSSGTKRKLTGQYSAATLWKQGTNVWYLMGDIAA